MKKVIFTLVAVLIFLPFLGLAQNQEESNQPNQQEDKIYYFGDITPGNMEEEPTPQETQDDQEDIEENADTGEEDQVETTKPETEIDDIEEPEEEVIVDEEEPNEEIVDIEPEEEEKITAGPKEITADFMLIYDFTPTDKDQGGSYKVKYTIQMGGKADMSTAIVRGKAKITAEVTGFLAQGQDAECALKISIPEAPYQIRFKQTEADEADIDIYLNKDKEIAETWQSTCTFKGGGAGTPFMTEGPTEKILSEALKKTSPPIKSIVAPIEANESTSTSIEISRYDVDDILGKATIKGTGIITIKPVTKAKTKSPSSFNKPSTLRRTSAKRVLPIPRSRINRSILQPKKATEQKASR